MKYTNMVTAKQLVGSVRSQWTAVKASASFLYWVGRENPYAAFARVGEANKMKPVHLHIPQHPFHVCVVSSSEDVRHVLRSSKYIKSKELREKLQPTFRHSLLNLNTCEEAKNQKHAVWEPIKQPCVRSIITELADEFIESLEARAGKGPFDIVPLISELTFGFMLKVVFRKELDGAHTAKFKTLVDTLLLETGKQLNIPLYPKSWVQAAAEGCAEFITDHLQEAFVEAAQVGLEERVKYLTDLLLGLAMAGYATVTALLGSTVKHIGEVGGTHQDMVASTLDEQEAREKVRNIILASGAIMPPVGALLKQAVDGDVLPSGVRVEAGSHVLVSLVQCVDKWDPDSLPYNTVFSVGPRSCPGQAVAMNLLTEAVLKLLTEYKVETKSASYAKLSMLCEYESLVVTLTKRR
eukprot:TRINITY_DN753_c0_g1_i1.p1 TRINITY_DN753_c0_g1~~TRINITY_DN753_c0_g1_i1.p1  ORF type:complete len:425 (+),score=153.66 TRINITY_DN753_c0_g1_i1:50-1276(+)